LGKLTHALAADPQHLADDALGAAHGLQGVRQDDVVEGLVAKTGQTALEVALDDVEAGRHALRDAVDVEVDAVALDPLFRCSRPSRWPSPQPRSSTRLPSPNPADDGVEVGALALPGGAVQGASAAMRAKCARITLW
jgi:hypothetical protein